MEKQLHMPCPQNDGGGGEDGPPSSCLFLTSPGATAGKWRAPSFFQLPRKAPDHRGRCDLH